MADGVGATPAERFERWLWPVLPVLVFVALFLLPALLVPKGSCYETVPAGTGGRLYLCCVVLLVLPLILGAARRLRSLASAHEFTRSELVMIAAAVAAAVFFTYLGVNKQHIGTLETLFRPAVPIAIGIYVWMVIGMITEPRIDRLGIVVPVALILVSGVVLIPFGWDMQELGRSGGFC